MPLREERKRQIEQMMAACRFGVLTVMGMDALTCVCPDCQVYRDLLALQDNYEARYRAWPEPQGEVA